MRGIVTFALGAAAAVAVLVTESDGFAARMISTLSDAGPVPGKPANTATGRMGVCFTPGSDCTGMIADEIGAARSEILVQAYGFTSGPIIQALGRAAERGVAVKVILDRSNATDRYSGATYLASHGITPLIDDQVAIAHNKVMVIDATTVITGSFNFTAAAQQRNAENVLVISGKAGLADLYSANWHRREAVSQPFAP